MVQPLWRTVWRFLNKQKIKLPYDPAVLLLGIYPEETMTQKDTCTPIFKIWKQPKCPWTRGMGKENVVIHTMEYYSAIKKDEIMPFAATWMDLEFVILGEVSQTKRNII